MHRIFQIKKSLFRNTLQPKLRHARNLLQLLPGRVELVKVPLLVLTRKNVFLALEIRKLSQKPNLFFP